MLNVEELKYKIFDKLKEFYYDKICGYVQGQLRNNIKLVRLSENIVTGIYTSKNKYIKLPSVSSFFILYECRNIDISWLIKSSYTNVLQPTEWINLETLCNEHNVNIDIYTTNGLMIPKRLCYITSSNVAGNYVSYIAIDNRVIKYIPEIQDVNVYLTVYVDTTIEKDIEVYSYIPGIDNENKLTYIITKYNNYPDKSIISLYINGWYYNLPPLSSWNTNLMKNNVIELIINNNVEFDFIQGDRHKYFSNIDSTFKDIIHIPKTFAKNKIYTINLFHIYLYDKTNKRGIKLPFTINANTYQITHNDVGIPDMAVNSTCQYLRSDNIEFRVQITKFTNELDPLIFDGQLIKLIYDYIDDINILEILKGNVQSLKGKVDAQTLEQSDFIKLLTEQVNLEEYSEQGLQSLINGLGYYHILEVLGNLKFEIDTTNIDILKSISVNKNILIDSGLINSFTPYVFVNGTKVTQEYIEPISTDDKCIINFTYNLHINENDQVDIVIDPTPISNVFNITPTADNHILTIENCNISNIKQFDIFIKEDISVYNLRDQNNQLYQYGYKKLSDQVKESYVVIEHDQDLKTTTFIFTNNSFNQDLYISMKAHTLIDIEYFNIEERNPTLYFKPKVKLTNKDEKVPFLNIEDFDIFLNGKLLIQNIGYNVKSITTNDGHIVDYIITIQDKDYLMYNTTNRLEIIGKSSVIEDQLSGFIVNNYFGTNDNINNLWLNNSSILYINGKYTRNELIEYTYKDWFKTKVNTPNISEFQIKTSIPETLDSVIKQYMKSNYSDIVTSVLNYLVEKNGQPIINPNMVVITKYKTIYSSLVNDVILDIVSRTLPDYVHNYTEDEIESFLQEFKFKEEFDLVMKNQVFEQIPQEFKFSNLQPNYIEVHPTINFDPRDLTEEETTPTKIILLRAIVDYILITKHYFDNN